MIELRPMEAEDATQAAEVLHEAFADADARAGRSSQVAEPEQVERLVRGLRRFAESDPGGCWVGVRGDSIEGFSAAVRRDGLWGLALLFVRPAAQSAGLGHRLMERSLETAEGATVGMIMSSEDPRAIRRYALAGFGLHPAMKAQGAVERSTLPTPLDVRDGTAADLDLVDEVDRALRGSSRAPDAEFALELGYRMLVSDGRGRRGFAIHRDGSPIMLGAESEAAASDLLWGCLAEANADIEAYGWTAEQRWAVDVALAARLQVTPSGPIFIRGMERPPGPWLPSGWYF